MTTPLNEMRTQLDECDRKFNPERLFWDVQLWWKEGVNAISTGGHFEYTVGDTVLAVVGMVAKWRNVDLNRVFQINCTLRTMDGVR